MKSKPLPEIKYIPEMFFGVSYEKSGYKRGVAHLDKSWHYPQKGELPSGSRVLIAVKNKVVGATTRTNWGKELVFVDDFGKSYRATQISAWMYMPELPNKDEKFWNLTTEEHNFL